MEACVWELSLLWCLFADIILSALLCVYMEPWELQDPKVIETKMLQTLFYAIWALTTIPW